MKQFSLGKQHKLCAKVAIDRLFAPCGDSHVAMSYPLRAVWTKNGGRKRGAQAQFLVTIPKKRIRHAVDRVTMRRRVREAYRLLRLSYVPSELPEPVDIAFIYVADRPETYSRIERSMKRLLARIFPKSNEPTS